MNQEVPAAQTVAPDPQVEAHVSPPAAPVNGVDRFCAQQKSAWEALAEIGEGLRVSAESLRQVSPRAGTLHSLREQYQREANECLLGPAAQFLRLQPIRRSLEAMPDCDREIAPQTLRARTRIDRQFQRLLASSTIELCEPWRIHLGGSHAREWHDWETRALEDRKKASTLLEQYAKWAGAAKPDAALAAGKRPELPDVWWRQHRAVVAQLEMEMAFCELGFAWFDATEDLADRLRRERREVLAGTTQTLDWIESGAKTGAGAGATNVELASPQERMRVWANRIEMEAARRLPERSEIVIPGRFPRWRSMASRDAFLTTFATHAKEPMSRIVHEYWEGTAKIVREVSRAREIIEYWRESSNSSSSQGLFSDALRNATAMVAQQAQTSDAAAELDTKLVECFRNWMLQGSTTLEIAQYGWTILRRPRGQQLAGAVARLHGERARKEAQRYVGWISSGWDRTLESFGGKVPERPSLQPVVRRTTLRDTLSLPVSKRELPEMYRMLFRLKPVEDQRFLVGREQELAGLEQALKDWESGRFAACLVVGARGSGKTSLLNCASADIFAGRSLIRGQFGERALTGAQIDAFLRRLIGIGDDVDLDTALASERRILMIEESERTYLRKVGGFRAVNHLIHLIHRTASTTLWIIVMNDKASRALDAGAQLSRVFSHRINAMSVSREDLERAILERHRLSGWRLEFARPPAGDPRVSKAREWMGLQDSPDKLFFQSLYQQSEGVFRSAFELWLSSIERVEGETLKIRQPLDPAFSRFRNELSQDDHFTLLAIQEHGSLTQSELAEVFCEAEEAGRNRMDRLAALGLIEVDPEHPGLRVRPEATRFVNDLLRRVNLT